jgi:hypothetical protein
VLLISIDDEGLGEELQVSWELEPSAKVHEKMALPEPTGFDAPARLDAFLDAVRWGASSMADTTLYNVVAVQAAADTRTCLKRWISS